MNDKAIYFPGLNGLRAISAIAVIVSHITLNLGIFNLNPYIFGSYIDGNPRGTDLAGQGVSIFFVLSGFLITYLLQVEKEVHQINIRKFYLRRIFRIWPLYYLYLILVIITIIIFEFDLNFKILFLYIFYAANIPYIIEKTLPFLAHYWSLGVEEQFYLFWPWVNKKINVIVWPILILIFVLLGSKIILHLFFPNSLLESVIHISRFHCMLMGALGATLYKNQNKLLLQLADNKLTQLICWVIIFFVAINKFHLASFIDTEIVSFVALLLIIGQIRINNRIINLETPILDFLGKISYGIYVIHPLIIFFVSKIMNQFTMDNLIKYILVYLSVITLTIILSYLSFSFFETYFLNIKKRFTVINSTSTK